MTNLKLYAVCIAISALVIDEGFACKKISPSSFGPQLDIGNGLDTGNVEPSTGYYKCGLCGTSISVTLVVRNQFREPYFEHKVTIKDQHQRQLIYFLQAAADMEPSQFKFSADYYGSMGFMITKLGGLGGSVEDKTFWEIIRKQSGEENLDYKSLELGVSSFVPLDSDVIMFNFTTWATGDGH